MPPARQWQWIKHLNATLSPESAREEPGIFIWKNTTDGPDYNFAQARFTGRNILLLCSNLWNPNITQKVLRNPTGSNFYFISTLEIPNIFSKNVLFSLNKMRYVMNFGYLGQSLAWNAKIWCC